MIHHFVGVARFGGKSGRGEAFAAICPVSQSVCYSKSDFLKPSVLCKQVLRSGTSVGAHYREACRAKSDADFINKMESGLQELDETAYWLELLVEAGIVKSVRLERLMQETNELIAILVTIVNKLKAKQK